MLQLRYPRSTILAISLLAAICALERRAVGERYALVIGIDGYEHLGKLKTCVNDAEALAKVLTEQGGFGGKDGRVIVLSDRSDTKPTLANIRSLVIKFTSPDNIRVDDTVLLFFSGHGAMVKERNYLVPCNGASIFV